MKKLSMNSWHSNRPLTLKLSFMITLFVINQLFNIESKIQQKSLETIEIKDENKNDFIHQIQAQPPKTTLPKIIQTSTPFDHEIEFEPENPVIKPIINTKEETNKSHEIFPELPTSDFKLPLPEIEEDISEFEPEKTYDIVERMPIFKLCDKQNKAYNEKLLCTYEEIRKSILENLKYPKIAIENNIQGTVISEIIIDTTGVIAQIKIPRTIGFGTDEAVLKILSALPEWLPGQQNNRKVPVRMFIPVKFQIKQ